MSSTYSWFFAVGAALVLAAPASAQQAVPANAVVVPATSAVQVTTPTAPTPVLSLAPTSESVALRVFTTPVRAPAASLAPLPAQGGQSTNVAMMIVGGAGLVVGSLIDGDAGTIIMVGGGVVGLIGLFRYLR